MFTWKVWGEIAKIIPNRLNDYLKNQIKSKWGVWYNVER
jgi:hypothetical protein